MNIVKWLLERAERKAYETVLAEISHRRQYHVLRSELSFYKDKYEDDTKGDVTLKGFPVIRLSSHDHSVIVDELSSLTQDIEWQMRRDHNGK